MEPIVWFIIYHLGMNWVDMTNFYGWSIKEPNGCITFLETDILYRIQIVNGHRGDTLGWLYNY